MLLISITWAQDHWETAVFAEDSWHYFIGLEAPPADWMATDFNDTTWLQGSGGIGYGDGVIGTPIVHAPALYLRTSFTLTDLDLLNASLLHYDYDDGIIIFLNGEEVYRSYNMGAPGTHVPYDGGVSEGHESRMYRGYPPEAYRLNDDLLSSIIHEGENILAVQVQNISAASSDLTGLVWLSFGIIDASTVFEPVPEWFFAPELFTSTLPIIMLDTQGRTIPDEPKIPAIMRVIDNGPGALNTVTDTPNGYFGHIGIEIRGASSQMYPKKQYAVETRDSLGENNNVELLGLPSENDWIFHAPYSDKSLIRNVLIYNLTRQTGHYATRTRYFDLFINEEYMGIYVLFEKIKRDNNRIDIAKLDEDETSGDDLTGGYIVKVDKHAGAETDRWFSPSNLAGYQGVYYQYHYPGSEDIVPEQVNYIQSFISEFEGIFSDGSYQDPLDGYYARIDWEQFIDYAIMQEFAKNVDGFRLSSFIYKDKDSNDPRVHMGPIWDFNLAFGNADYYDGANPIGWYFDTNFQGDPWPIPFWWYLIWDDETFKYAFNARWQELRQSTLSNEHINGVIDSLVAEIDVSIDRNYEVWPVLDSYVWPNAYIGGTYENELNYVRDWISSRLTWMDAQTQELGVNLPLSRNIQAAYPNPFNPSQTLNFHTESPGLVDVLIFDVQGRLVNRLRTESGNDGTVSLNWDGRDAYFQNAPSGVYFLVSPSIKSETVFKVTLLR